MGTILECLRSAYVSFKNRVMGNTKSSRVPVSQLENRPSFPAEQCRKRSPIEEEANDTPLLRRPFDVDSMDSSLGSQCKRPRLCDEEEFRRQLSTPRAPNARAWFEKMEEIVRTGDVPRGDISQRAKQLKASDVSAKRRQTVVIDLTTGVTESIASSTGEGHHEHRVTNVGAAGNDVDSFDRYRRLIAATDSRSSGSTSSAVNDVQNILDNLQLANNTPSRLPRVSHRSFVREEEGENDAFTADHNASFDVIERARKIGSLPPTMFESPQIWDALPSDLARSREFEADAMRDARLRSQHCSRARPSFKEELLVRVLPPINRDMIPLNEPQLDLLALAWSAGHPGQVFVDAFSLHITRKDFLTMRNGAWLNDECINFYMELIANRVKSPVYKYDRPLPTVYVFNTFMYSNLISDGYAKIRRWTRRVDVFSFDLLLVPVHLGVHWCLAVIDTRTRVIRYYDSMGGHNQHGLDALLDYLQQEHMDKKKTPLNTATWELVHEKKIPQQRNGFDCGMFACKLADFVSRDLPLSFSQTDMRYFRERAVVEIMQKQLMA